jgi:ribosomal protein S18 acetylase RimI-like enzyme
VVSPLRFQTIDLALHGDLCVAFRRDAHVCSFGTAADFDRDYGDGGARYSSWLRDRIAELPDGVVHAFRGDVIVGQIEMRIRHEPPSARVNLFYLVPVERGSGAGDELHGYVVALLRRHGIPRAELSVAPGNARAIRFYERHGWRDVGSRADEPEVRLMVIELDAVARGPAS